MPAIVRTQTLVERYALAPAEIERTSLAMVEQALDQRWIDGEREVAKRMIYAAGDVSLAGLIRIHREAVPAAVAAIGSVRPIVCDVKMVSVGLRASACPIHVAISQPEVVERARSSGLPRAVEGMRLSKDRLDGAIAVIGNAPTALLALLDMVDAGECRPALIIGAPVGFVAAAESKAELQRRDIPYVTLEGTRGGSAIAAAAMNALLLLAETTGG